MAEAYVRYQDMMDGDTFNVRDHAMYQDFLWHQARLRRRPKIIVWCATVHAAKTLRGISVERVPLGQYLYRRYRQRMAVVGFAALSGQYRQMNGKLADIAEPTADSLEEKALRDSAADLRYLDARQLTEFGAIAARPLSYDKPNVAEWSKIVDAMVVIREERAPSSR